MKRTVVRVAPHATARVVGILHLIFGLLMMPLVLLPFWITSGQPSSGLGYTLAMPVFYAVTGYLVTALFCALYNLVAGWVGGVEIEIAEGSGASTGSSA